MKKISHEKFMAWIETLPVIERPKVTRDYPQFREWAEALVKDNPMGIGESLMEYADAWEKDKKEAERLRALQFPRALIERPTWRPFPEFRPLFHTALLILDDDGCIDIGEYRHACQEISGPHIHRRRGICAEPRYWCYLTDFMWNVPDVSRP